VQPVVSSADKSLPAAGSAESLLHCQCADGCEGMNNVCVNEVTLVHHGIVKESIDWPSVEHVSGHMYGDQVAGTTQFKSHGSVQITDVRDRLKKC